MAVLEVQQIRENRPFDIEVTTANAAADHLILYECSEERIRTAYGLAPTTKVVVNGFLKNLRMEATIRSLTAVPMPDFPLGTSDQQKKSILYDAEWNSPRKEIHFFTGGTTLIKRPGIALPHFEGMQTRAFNVLKYLTDNLSQDFGPGRRLACRFKNVDYGFPDADLDEITISGDVAEEIFIFTDSSLLTKVDIQTFTLWGDEIVKSNGTGNPTITKDTAQRYGYYSNFAPAGLNDEFTFSRILKAGSYTLKTLGITEPAGGRLTLFVNDVSQGFVSFYSASTTYDVVIETPFTIAIDGLYTFRLRMAGRSVQNTTGYTQKITKMWAAL